MEKNKGDVVMNFTAFYRFFSNMDLVLSSWTPFSHVTKNEFELLSPVFNSITSFIPLNLFKVAYLGPFIQNGYIFFSVCRPEYAKKEKNE
jgi:hypothetical protein